jgi:hypothetical protein
MAKNKSIHNLCARCQNTCKQPATTGTLTCGMFKGKMDDEEFNQLLSEMEDLIENVKHLNHRTSDLLANMRDTDQDMSSGKTGG